MSASRQKAIAKLMWNDGGYGLGICSVAAGMIWSMDRPGPGRPDLPSVVAVCGPDKKYTKRELEKLAVFAAKRTAAYDKMFGQRRGANLIIFDKTEWGRWMRKRLTWNSGPMYSPTLDEAVAVMDRN
ncbi:MAG: hypothetical protein HY457_00595 [Parcubacteria group bacterium]|nr:hypothetical protein [Parcubacteria group bacterium]